MVADAEAQSSKQERDIPMHIGGQEVRTSRTPAAEPRPTTTSACWPTSTRAMPAT
ncbi:MAG: hypothetical protein WKG07_32950 [Hymenobacter sp.]